MGTVPNFWIMQGPNIETAIPKRRYRLGEFNVVILGDITSKEAMQYQYILAVVREGESEPGLYLTMESRAGDDAPDSSFDMRLIMRDGSRTISSLKRSSQDLENFTSQGLQIVQTILNLQDEEPRRLM